MRKTMLTVFYINQRARSFYASHGYVTDATSPSNDDGERHHYVILCKPHPDLVDKRVELRQRAENFKKVGARLAAHKADVDHEWDPAIVHDGLGNVD